MPMENRVPKNRYNGGAAPDVDKQDKPDVLKMIETAMDKRAAGMPVHSLRRNLS